MKRCSKPLQFYTKYHSFFTDWWTSVCLYFWQTPDWLLTCSQLTSLVTRCFLRYYILLSLDFPGLFLLMSQRFWDVLLWSDSKSTNSFYEVVAHLTFNSWCFFMFYFEKKKKKKRKSLLRFESHCIVCFLIYIYAASKPFGIAFANSGDFVDFVDWLQK